MFGYVIVDKPSLRVREFEYYKATYCGLCHAQGKCTGCLSRLTLSYDMTFFVLLREMLEETKTEFVKKRCPRHPIHAINTVKVNGELEYSANVSGILTSGKIADNINDESGARRIVARLAAVLFSTMEKKSKKALPELSSFVDEKLSELSELEAKRTASIDAPADISGQMTAELLSYGLEGERAVVARGIGKRIGRWVYIVDALDDYESDRKSGAYNPFVLLYNGADFTDENIISIGSMLEAELEMAFSALDLLDEDPERDRTEIIKNILSLGMPASVKKVCKKYTKDNQ